MRIGLGSFWKIAGYIHEFDKIQQNISQPSKDFLVDNLRDKNFNYVFLSVTYPLGKLTKEDYYRPLDVYCTQKVFWNRNTMILHVTTSSPCNTFKIYVVDTEHVTCWKNLCDVTHLFQYSRLFQCFLCIKWFEILTL